MSWITDLLICLRFFSRLPVPETERERQRGRRGFAQAVAMAPIAGAVIGLVPSAALFAALGVGLPPMLAATLSIATLVACTGALHEDGLADCADGFGGGQTPDRKLEIMRDSRIGTFGVCALVLAFMLRAGSLASIVMSVDSAFTAIVAAAVVSRTLCLCPLVLLEPARADGVGASAAQPDSRAVMVAFGLCAAILIALGLFSGRPVVAIVAGIVAGVADLGFCGLAHRQIRGQTGDVAGAVQQATEVVVLLVFAAAAGS